MKIVLADVISADGFITRGDAPDVAHWSSKEDWEHFLALRQQYDVLVMGRKTYEAVRPKPDAERLRLVLTTQPESYAAEAVPGQLEFADLAPQGLVTFLEGRGYESLLLLGGGTVNGAFLTAGLGNELYLTIEPWLFGRGRPLLGGVEQNISLQLLESKQLNSRGTLLLHYSILHTTP